MAGSFVKIKLCLDAVVAFEQLNYTVNETDNVQEVCLQVFNPPSNDTLSFNISLVYETRAGTAGE